MKKFKDLTQKEIDLWEKYIQTKLMVEMKIPSNLLRSYWEDKYNNEKHIYHPIWNTKPTKTVKVLNSPEEHRTFVENITRIYDECV